MKKRAKYECWKSRGVADITIREKLGLTAEEMAKFEMLKRSNPLLDIEVPQSRQRQPFNDPVLSKLKEIATLDEKTELSVPNVNPQDLPFTVASAHTSVPTEEERIDEILRHYEKEKEKQRAQATREEENDPLQSSLGGGTALRTTRKWRHSSRKRNGRGRKSRCRRRR